MGTVSNGNIKKQQFLTYQTIPHSDPPHQSGKNIAHTSKIINDSFPTENVYLVLELIHLYPNIFEADVSWQRKKVLYGNLHI